MKRLIILSVLTLSLSALWAQNPGYLGKHFAISVNGNLSLDYGGIKLDQPSMPLLKVAHIVPEATLEYTIHESRSLFVSGRVFDGFAQMDCDVQTNYGYEYWNNAILPVKTYTLVAGFRTYFQDMAPLGTFLGVGVVYNQMSYDFAASSHNWRFNDDDIQRRLYGLQVDLGRKYIFQDILLMEIGVRYGITAAYPFAEKMNFEEAGPFHSIAANNWMSNMFALRIGIGLLPF